jgi:hypothetical protein
MARVAISDFSLGMHPEVDPNKLPIGAGERLQNVRFGRRSLTARYPRQTFSAYPDGAGACRDILEYVRYSSDPTVRMVGVFGEQVIATDTADQTFDSTPVVLETTIPLTATPFLLQRHRDLYLLDGKSSVKRWHGGTFLEAIYQDVGTGPGPVFHEGCRYTGTTTSLFVLTITKAGPRGEAEFSWTQTGGSDGSDTDVMVTDFVDLVDGVTIDWLEGEYVLGDSWKFRATHAEAVDELIDVPKINGQPDISLEVWGETLVQKWGDPVGVGWGDPEKPVPFTWRAYTLPDVEDFNGDATADFATQYPEEQEAVVRQLTESQYVNLGDSVIALEYLKPASRVAGCQAWAWMKVQFETAQDWSHINTYELVFKILAGIDTIGSSRLYFQFGTVDDETQLAHTVEIPLTHDGGISYNSGDWLTATVDLSSVLTTDRTAVKYAAIAWYCEQDYSSQRAQQSDGMLFPDEDEACTLIVDRFRPAERSRDLLPTTYDLCCAVGQFTTGRMIIGKACDAESFTVEVPDAAFLVASITLDAGTALTADDKIFLYARGGMETEWRQVAWTRAVPGQLTYQIRWGGNYPTLADILQPYSQVPPKGCTHAFVYGDRIGWVKDDQVYLSTADDVERVPTGFLSSQYDRQGTVLQIGRDGNDVLGSATLGTYQVLFKRIGLYTLRGVNIQEFVPTLLDAEYGCVAPRTICVVGDGSVVWLDPAHGVMRYDGNGAPAPLGELTSGTGSPLLDELQSFAIADLSNAFAVYDPATDAYHLTVPRSGTFAGVTFAYFFRGGGWVEDTGQPSACACLARWGAHRGMIAADTSGSALHLLNRDDAALTATEASVLAYYRSGGLFEPNETYKLLSKAWVTTARAGSGDVTFLYWANNVAGDPTESLLYTLDNMGVARWMPKVSVDTMSCLQVGLLWDGVATPIEINSLMVDFQEVGEL